MLTTGGMPPPPKISNRGSPAGAKAGGGDVSGGLHAGHHSASGKKVSTGGPRAKVLLMDLYQPPDSVLVLYLASSQQVASHKGNAARCAVC